MELLVNIVLSSIFLVLSLAHLKKRQINCEYLLPGWIIVVLLYIYSVPAALLFYINPDLINVTFDRSLTYDSVLGCQLCFTVALFAFLLSELSRSISSKNALRFYRIGDDIEQKRSKYIILILLLFIASVFLYIQRWSSVGGVRAMLLMGRADALYEMQTGGGNFARYDIFLFLSVSLFIPFIVAPRLHPEKGFRLLMFILFGVFFFILLLAGTRLPIVSILVGSIALLFTFKKELLKKNAKKIIVTGTALYLLLNAYSFFRGDVFNLSQNVNNRRLSTVEVLFPNETLTAYLSYDAMIQYPDLFYENQLLKIVPSSARRFFGYGSFVPYSARLQDLQQTQSTLTVPFPIDLFFGTYGSHLLIFILSLLVFILIDYLFKSASKMKYGSLLMIWMYLLSFYFIRTEAIAWFSRGLLLFILGLPLIWVLNVRHSR